MQEWAATVRVSKVRTPEGVVALTVEEAEEPATPRPLVFVVHGVNSRKERHLELCLALARAGLLACALDATDHGERSTPEAAEVLAGPATSVAFAEAFLRAVLGTVGDLAVLARELGRDRYGLIGHSMGGYVALKAATAADPALGPVVSIAGNPDWAAQAAGSLLPWDVRNAVQRVSPLTSAADIWPRPLLMLHSDADQTVPIDGARRLYAELAAGSYAADPERLSLVEYPGLGHEFVPDMVERSVAWMRRWMGEEAETT
jgi:alpha-beta hydrolase superfamily lysophospholipase